MRYEVLFLLLLLSDQVYMSEDYVTVWSAPKNRGGVVCVCVCVGGGGGIIFISV